MEDILAVVSKALEAVPLPLSELGCYVGAAESFILGNLEKDNEVSVR